MLLQIPEVFSKAEIKALRARLDAGPWADGNATSGHQSATAKKNLQLPEDSDVAKEVSALVVQALNANPMFVAAALPHTIFPPLFNRYEGGEHYGNHVDNAIRSDPLSGQYVRTDVSCTLFFSNPDEYQGGELVAEDTYGLHSFKLPAGAKPVISDRDFTVITIAGTGANSTAEAIELAQRAKAVGVDACLTVVPYYNKPTQEGQYQHFKAIAEATGDLPIVLYNVPGRSVADMAHDTVLRLTQVPGIVGIKEATGNIERAQWLIKDAPKEFSIYSGDDPTAVALMLCGGHGNVSVTANVAPRLMHELCKAAIAGDVARAMEIQMKLLPVHKTLFIESNPIPVKWAVSRMGLSKPALRLPLTPLTEASQPALEKAMQTAGLI